MVKMQKERIKCMRRNIPNKINHIDRCFRDFVNCFNHIKYYISLILDLRLIKVNTFLFRIQRFLEF